MIQHIKSGFKKFTPLKPSEICLLTTSINQGIMSMNVQAVRR